MMNWKWQRNFALLALFAGVFLLTADFAEARRGGGRSAGISRSGPAASGSVRGNRGETKRDVRGEKRETKKDIRGERRDTKKDIRDDRRDFREDVYDDRRRDRRRWRVGSTLTAATFRNLNCNSRIVTINGVRHYHCGSTWYQRAYHGGSVTYVIVKTPAGY